MPIIEVKLLEGRDDSLKELLIARVTETVSETLQVSPQSVRVVLYDISLAHWGIGGVSAKQLRNGKQ